VPVTAALRPCGQSSCNVYLSGAPFGINVIKGTRRRPQLIPCGQHPPQPRGKLCSLVLELTKTARRARRLSDTVRPAVTGHPAGRSRGASIRSSAAGGLSQDSGNHFRPEPGLATGETGFSLGGEIGFTGFKEGLAIGFNLGIQCSKSARNVTLYNTHAKECRKGARLVIHTIIVYVTRCPDMSGFRTVAI
jgi:hypothetical protein